MWIMLTRNDTEPVLVNIDRLTHIGPRLNNGSTLYFVNDSQKEFYTKQKVLAVRETVLEIYALLRARPKIKLGDSSGL